MILDCSECWVKMIEEVDTSLVLLKSSVIAYVIKKVSQSNLAMVLWSYSISLCPAVCILPVISRHSKPGF